MNTSSDDDMDMSTDSVEDLPTSIWLDLAQWVTDNNVDLAKVNSLLKILRQHDLDLPKDARTLLKTPPKVEVLNKCGGQYAYLGVAPGIRRILQNTQEIVDSVSLKINVDGIPLFKSSNKALTPILASFDDHNPFVVALFCGSKKPQPMTDYLEDFLREMEQLHQTGIVVDNRTVSVSVSAFICDAPARQMLKATKGHTGFESCERCEVQGYTCSHDRFVLYSRTDCEPRTDAKFANLSYKKPPGVKPEGHQLDEPPLGIDFPCVTRFPLDYMHLVCLGIMRRLIVFWKRGDKICNKGRLSYELFERISRMLQEYYGRMPSCFARQPRALSEFDRWKATEFRQFLLYTGIVVLKGVLSQEHYTHFLSLSIAMRYLLETDDDIRTHNCAYARELLHFFVHEGFVLYSEHFVTYNVHSALHLCDDVQTFSCSLNDINAFAFENALQGIKKKVRNGRNPVAQIVKRLEEEHHVGMDKRHHAKDISLRPQDSCYFLGDHQYVFVKEARPNDHYLCDVLSSQWCEDWFTEPLPSRQVDIAYCSSRNWTKYAKSCLVHKSNLCRQVVWLEMGHGFVFIPLVHKEI